MSLDPRPTFTPANRAARRRFLAAIGLFGAWVIGLAILASTTGEKARPEAPAAGVRP